MPIAAALTAAIMTLLHPIAALAADDAAEISEETAVSIAVPTGPEADQITRLYITALGRTPHPEGHAFWTNLRLEGRTLAELAEMMIGLPEPQAKTSGDWIVDAYRNGLERTPDAGGYAFWSERNPGEAIAAIADSVELQEKTGTLPPPVYVPEPYVEPLTAERLPVAPAGWVDAGNGVFVPPVLIEIRRCESTHNYLAANPRSSARGAYQFLTSSWAAYGHDVRYGVTQAHLATPAQQDEAAVITWKRDGTRPWNASRHCWS